MYGDLQGIAGKAFQEIDGLAMPLLETHEAPQGAAPSGVLSSVYRPASRLIRVDISPIDTPDMPLLTFEQSNGQHRRSRETAPAARHGFSIALKPDIFSYGSLYRSERLFHGGATYSGLFQALGTTDFEIVIRHLQSTATVVEVYRPSLVRLAARLRQDAALIKDALVSAVARRHPDRPY